MKLVMTLMILMFVLVSCGKKQTLSTKGQFIIIQKNLMHVLH